jgi:hypothetical protein
VIILGEGCRNAGRDRQKQLETPLKKSIHESGNDTRRGKKKKKKYNRHLYWLPRIIHLFLKTWMDIFSLLA